MFACVLMTGDSRPDDAASDYALAPDAALLVTAQGNAFAFDMRNSFYALSPVAAAMLERTLRGGKAHAAATIAAEFNTDTARVDADLDLFVGDLEARDSCAGATRTPSPTGSAFSPARSRVPRGAA